MITKLPEFNYKEGNIAGDAVYLVTPKEMGVKWNNENKHFRSSIIRQSDGYVVSRGFNKFVNFGEQPDFEPWDTNCKFDAIHKMDGSLLCVSKYKGNTIIRTRGVFDAREHETGEEIDYLEKRYPFAFKNTMLDLEQYSLLYEHTTPNRVIVIREHQEPTITLLGMIDNQTGLYATQDMVDMLAEKLAVPRPKKYSYSSIVDCINDVKAWKGAEGVVLYSPNGQILKKIKADEYLRIHRAKSAISSISNLIDLFIESGSHTADDFYRYIELTLDHELAEIAKPDIVKIGRANWNYGIQCAEVNAFVKSENMKHLDRKEQAMKIIKRYDDWRKGVAFSILDGKEPTKKAKILEELIDNSTNR